MASATRNPAATAVHSRRLVTRAVPSAAAIGDGSSAATTSAAEAKRSSGLRARQRRIV